MERSWLQTIGLQMEGVSNAGAIDGQGTMFAPWILSGDGNVPSLDSVGAFTKVVAHISHDLRQPLTAILANAEFLSQPDISQMQRDAFYKEIRLSIDRMDDLVSSLLKWSRGDDSLRPAARNIVDTVGRAIRMVRARQEFRLVKIVHRHEGRAMGWFDANRLERAISNLVLNACEAVASKQGLIVISTNGNRTSLQVNVRDNGPGVPASIRDSLFEPFVSCGKAAGNGLGLAIAKKIAEDHSGKIYLDRTIKSGTLITISIPFPIPRTGCVAGSTDSAPMIR
jgi:signal transduction histidine kinase